MIGCMLGTGGACGKERKMDMNEKNKNGYSVGNCLH